MRRQLFNLAFRVSAGLCAALACGLLIGLVAMVLSLGLPGLRAGLFLGSSGPGIASGGILLQILGTCILVATALVVSAPLALGLALVQEVYLESANARRRLRLALYALNGVPSIVFGIFGLVVFVYFFDWGKSWLAGGILLGLMILPTLTVSLAERIRALPESYLDAARALGMTRAQTVRSVVLPQARGGLVTGALLGLARAAGETAPIMFTAAVFAGATLPHGIQESPVLALPYHIFVLAQDSLDPAAGNQMWAAALVLLGLVLAFSLLALPARLRHSEEAHHG